VARVDEAADVQIDGLAPGAGDCIGMDDEDLRPTAKPGSDDRRKYRDIYVKPTIMLDEICREDEATRF
jgi:predicted AAA+ superfamily ATPase